MTRNKKLVKMMALAVAASTVATSVPAYAAFDATYYAQQNPDVVAAIGTKPADLEMHYNVFGKKEGRAGSADEIGGSALRQLFDAEYYAKLNPDVVAVYGNDANALFSHFLQFGIKEGRKINPYFDVNAYKKAYPDLVAAFGDDIAAYYNHFANHGIKEHRTLGGFPAEKIVPGGVAVASSGGSSSSSSGGGGGSSSKPAPKPADTTPAEQVTPTPDPTPQPTPTPDDGKQEESLPSEVEVAQAAIENATKKVEAELEKYDSENLPTDAQKAELVKSTKAIVDSSRELKDQTAQAATAAAAELTAAEAKLTSLQAKIAAGAAKTASLTAASNIRGAADAEVAVLDAQYDVEVKQAAYNEAVKERKAAQVAYDSAMDVARDLIKNVFEKDPSTYDSTFLRHDPTPGNPSSGDEDGVADVLEALYKVTNTAVDDIDLTDEDTTLGDKLRKALIVKDTGKLDSAETVANKKKAYVTGKVDFAKEEAVKALIDEYFELAAEAQPTATSTARMSAILKELYGATVVAYNKDGAVVTPGSLVDTEVVNETVAYKWADGVDADNTDGVEKDEVLALILGNVTGKVSSIDEEKLAADATTEIETMISNYEKCQEADDKLTNPNGDGKTAEDVLLKAVYDEKEAEMNLYNANVVLNGGTKKKIDDSVGTEHVQDVKFVSKDENAEIKGKVELRDEAVKDKDTSIAARDAIYAAEGLDGATRESLGAADAQAEVVAADVIAKGKADIAADKADKANEKAEKNWTEAKALDTQKDENAQP